MKEITEIKVEKTSTRVKSTMCDLCEVVFDGEDWGAWSSHYSHEIKSTSVKMETGNGGRSGGHIRHVSFDICPECFSKKLVPTLKAMGATPTVKVSDW